MGEAGEQKISEAVEAAAGRRLGVRRWDCPLIYRDAAEAATDSDLPYWLILGLSGAIATLGLAIDSAAVVIGAMLVAPLLAPVMGLAVALVVGDARLALQTGVVVVASAGLVIAVAALLTAALPFHTITLEISARTRPTTLDLAIATFSGVVGAVVTVAREHRLSAAIPGVVVAVALIPPLAVAGFGVGAGEWHLIYGSMLLFGANLAGIVLSGMAVFMLIGLYRRDMVRVAGKWHETSAATGLAARIGRLRWLPDPGGMSSPRIRVALVVGFVLLMGIPLSETLGEIAREVRITAAVDRAAERFDHPGRSTILNREVLIANEDTHVHLRVATVEWFDDQAATDFEREASMSAREPVTLALEQLPLTADGEADPDGADESAPAAASEVIAVLRPRLRRALDELPVPAGVRMVGGEIAVGAGYARVTAGYLAEQPLAPQAEEVLARHLARSLQLAGVETEFEHLPTAVLHQGPTTPDLAVIDTAARAARRYPDVALELQIGADAAGAAAESTEEALRAAGVRRERVRRVRVSGDEITLRLRFSGQP